jgi:thioredoxin reductase (NADPH)
MAHGRIDYYVLRPSGTPDEVFHQAVSSFLLDWSHGQKIAPHTIHVVGDSWSGRAYEIRDALERFAGEVRAGAFPEEQHTYSIPDDELERFEELVGRHDRERRGEPADGDAR